MFVTKTRTNIDDIISWFNHKHMKDTNSHAPFSQTKMMQLLYMLQGIDLVVYNHPAFKDDILNIGLKPYIYAVQEYYHVKPLSHYSMIRQDYKNINKNIKLKHLISTEYKEFTDITKVDSSYKQHVFNKHTEHLVLPKSLIKCYFSKYILEL